MYLSIKQFKHLLEERNFVIYTAHKPITYAIHQNNEKASPIQLHHLQYISQFSTNISRISGENIVADSLSRIESISEIDYDKIADAQVDNEELNKLRLKPSLNFKQYPLDSGPFPVSEGKINCLTCIDRFTCWIEVIPLSNTTAETVAREFYSHWISHFGMPYRVITDQGTQFRSELFKNIGIICGFKVCTTTSYHPQCNGKIERIHRTLKAAIRVHNSVKWTQTLPTVLLGLRSVLHSDINYTIAQMVYGQTIRLPGEFFEKPKNVLDTDTFAEELQKQMDQLQPLKTRRQPSP
ncbi:transposon Ty3-I Gag-Pol polyprotein [Trichonephila clavipes]|uniref:Transposon Ty3-I Gag-Pol polyprotein n=1 Tax=Trichonephila clavipes TaxID=2585209 RepID=A0A8X6R8S6_TRICX|nr:transposon Ty3-I Gag-Pol polyprotein [Trichonephila clavipes]